MTAHIPEERHNFKCLHKEKARGDKKEDFQNG